MFFMLEMFCAVDEGIILVVEAATLLELSVVLEFERGYGCGRSALLAKLLGMKSILLRATL
jgi:hypothetical protein